MKKLILFATIILMASNFSFGIGFPHGYSKKKKTEQVAFNKRDSIKMQWKVISWANAACEILMKVENNQFLRYQ